MIRALLATTFTLLATAGAASAQPPAGDGARFSTSAEYLLWWVKDAPAAPPLLSTGTLAEPDFSAVLGGRPYDLGTPQVFAGGLFAQPTNIGHHRRDRFAVVPEVGLKIGYRLTSWASVVVGYTFLYANKVVRPGDQVDRAVNTTQSTTYQRGDV